MAKSKKRKKPRASKIQHRIVNRKKISITGEAEYIISRAEEYDSRVVSFGLGNDDIGAENTYLCEVYQ